MSTIPSNKELFARFQKINESDVKVINETGPEDNAGFKAGEAAGVLSKDDHSKPVKRDHEAGASEAPQKYEGNDKELETKTGSKREAGADKAADKFEGTDKAANDDTKQERTENGLGKAPVAKGASKTFAEFRDKIRAKMGLALDDKLNKGNDGKLN